MPNAKNIIAHDATGGTLYCIIEREADGYLLDDADGTFGAAPADPYVSLTEHATVKGRYDAAEARRTWDDGLYTVAVYRCSGPSPSPGEDTIAAVGELVIRDDAEVYLDAPVSFVHKWILNKLVEDPQNTWTLYDDDGATPLKTWTWHGSSRTRSKAV